MLAKSLAALRENLTLPDHLKARLMRRARRIAVRQIQGKGMGPLEYKSAPADTVEVDEKLGRVVAYYAAFGNKDLGDDIVHPGATLRSVERRFSKVERPQVRVLYGHAMDKVVGHPVRMEEDKHGALAETQYNLGTFWGNEVFHLVKEGDISGNSFGYLPGEGTQDQPGFEYDDEGTRHLYEVDVHEYGPLAIPMNNEAFTVGVKGAFDHNGPFINLVEQAMNLVTDVVIEAEALAMRRAERKTGVKTLGDDHIEALQELVDAATAASADLAALIAARAVEAKTEGQPPPDTTTDATARALQLQMELARARLRHAGIKEISLP